VLRISLRYLPSTARRTLLPTTATCLYCAAFWFCLSPHCIRPRCACRVLDFCLPGCVTGSASTYRYCAPGSLRTAFPHYVACHHYAFHLPHSGWFEVPPPPLPVPPACLTTTSVWFWLVRATHTVHTHPRCAFYFSTYVPAAHTRLVLVPTFSAGSWFCLGFGCA